MKPGLLLQVVSTFTSTPIEPSLRCAVADAGIADALRFVQYGQVSEYLLGPASDSAEILGTIILLRIEDWLRENLKSPAVVSVLDREQEKIRQELGKRADEFINQVRVLSRRGKQVWFLACPSRGWISERHKLRALCQTYTNLLVARVRALPEITVLTWSASLFTGEPDDRNADRLGQIPFTQDAFDRLGRFLGNQVARTVVRGYPCATAPASSGSSELAAYLAGLRVNVELVLAGPGDRAHIDRILWTAAAFSLAGEHPDISAEQIDALIECECCMLISVSDRICEHGVSGLVIFRAVEDSLVVKAMALSCTVLGKQVEYAVISALARIAEERGLVTLVFEYCPSERNQPMLRFLQTVAESAGTYWALPVNLVETRIRAAAADANAWTLNLRHSCSSAFAD